MHIRLSGDLFKISHLYLVAETLEHSAGWLFLLRPPQSVSQRAATVVSGRATSVSVTLPTALTRQDRTPSPRHGALATPHVPPLLFLLSSRARTGPPWPPEHGALPPSAHAPPDTPLPHVPARLSPSGLSRVPPPQPFSGDSVQNDTCPPSHLLSSLLFDFPPKH